ncbi:SigE family RNA polymerase sigma factor [Streptomyces sp. H10-C2]|uniref:SigE family RNA polymerase sigma factor n=1 Tax=unclassified Streptomyces TaxID=2593676 RepID=UPI0024B9F8F3|nr:MULTISPECIES: SigE family RNA polymerase sigma factor [unclassified Streptomyces]MDJ0340479.1 SigE family RNA polymerase sigma factor [Streptomyces sp. PH10-H1]MDJ0370127.1 SigE family RNA polymerase sigma factor [Streptomyces sp. H10-C2]
MNALHSTTTTAVLQPRPHTAGRNEGKSGAAGGRGCARGTGRQQGQPAGQVVRNRPPYMTAIEGGAASATSTATVTGTANVTGTTTATQTIPVQRHDSLAEAEFTAYVQQRRASLYATAYHLTGDRYEAEDLLQSALFSTYRAWDRISDKAAVGGYLRRTMTNLHISAWRRRKLNEYPTEELPETVGESDAMGGTELRAVLWQALAKVPETQRTMLVLRYYEGRTDPEIADILGISVGTVKSSIWRSLRRMREDEALSFGRDADESFGELVA